VPQRFLLPQLYKQANRPAAVEQAAEREVHNFTACRINHAGVVLYAAALRLRYA
jgi:predicted exporter